MHDNVAFGSWAGVSVVRVRRERIGRLNGESREPGRVSILMPGSVGFSGFAGDQLIPPSACLEGVLSLSLVSTQYAFTSPTMRKRLNKSPKCDESSLVLRECLSTLETAARALI